MWVAVVLMLLTMWGFGGWLFVKAWVDHEAGGLLAGIMLWALTGLASRNVFFGLRRRLRA